MAAEYRLARKRLDFRPDAVLTAGMLEELDNFPHQLLEFFYQDYCAGIVAGLDFRERDGNIILSPGLARVAGAFYSLERELNLSDLIANFLKEHSTQGKRWNIVLAPDTSEVLRGVPVDYLRFEFSERPGDNVEKLQLAGFSAGLRPRLPDVDGPRLVESFLSSSSLYLLDTPMAAVREADFPPAVFVAARNTLMAKKRKSSADLALLFSLSQSTRLSMLAVKNFIQLMGGKIPQGRRELFQEFFHCLNLENQESWIPMLEEKKPTPRQTGPTSVLIDD